jgi:prepilin-type N-terminal cleavage/methylation domain-containing protein
MSAPRQRWRGLTLVELMVVLLIIGIATAVTLLALPATLCNCCRRQDHPRVGVWHPGADQVHRR